MTPPIETSLRCNICGESRPWGVCSLDRTLVLCVECRDAALKALIDKKEARLAREKAGSA